MLASDLLGYKRNIAAYITISDYQRGLLIEMGMPPDKLITIPNPVRLLSAPQPLDQAHVLFFGRLEEYKGIKCFLDLAARFPQIRFIIAGDGSKRGFVTESIAARGMTNVFYRGMLNKTQLTGEIRTALCVVVPSLWPEAFGLAAVEALGEGVPVIASAIGGMLDTVADGIDGYLVPPGDVEAMATVLRSWIENPAAAKKMGMAGHLRMSEEFSPALYYRRTLDVYHELIGKTEQF